MKNNPIKDNETVWRFFKEIFPEKKFALIGSSLLLVASGLLDAVGLSLVVPTVSFLISDTSSNGVGLQITNILKQSFNFIGIPYSLRYILSSIAVIMLLRSILIFIQSSYIAHIQTKYNAELGLKYNQFLSGSNWVSFKKNTQSVANNIMIRESSRAGASLKNLANMLSNFYGVIIYIIFFSLISYRMALISIILSIGIIAMFTNLMRISRRLGKQQTFKARNVIQDVADSLNLAKFIRTHGKQNYMTKKLSKSIDGLRDNQFKLGKNEAIFMAFYEYAFIGFLLLGLLIATRYFNLSSSVIALITLILVRLFQKVKGFQQFYQACNKNMSGYFSIARELEKPYENNSKWGTKKFNNIKDNLSIRNASLAIDGNMILKKVNLTIQKNQINIITGRSGIGKTTLIDVITGLMDLDEGTITINGKNLNEYSKESYQNSIGYVDQNPTLFNENILNNLKWGSKGVSKKRVFDVTKSLKIHNFITKLPDGYSTNVGDFGDKLSGGEKQRIAIARTLLLNPKILILDEATSQLDSNSQNTILSLIKKLKKDMTIIMITHREETLSIADNIIELK